ncbi:MAG TPA: DUF998 domain-containing protein [Pseudonocardiaceae bacterium]|nr:DUF998 domain-containing protein [Pseudonocardiaceae bacterium]
MNVGGAVDRAAVVRVVFGAIAVAVLAMVALHLLGAGRLNPATTTVSDYVSLPGGALLLAIAVLAVALATAAVPVGLLRAGLPGKVCWPFGLGCAGLVATIAFPTNALGTAESPATVLHRYAAGVFFVSLPVAALMVLRQLPNRLVRLGTAVSVVAGVLFLVSHIPLLLPDWPGAHEIADVLPRGLAERALLTVDIALLGTLALATRSTSKPGAVR